MLTVDRQVASLQRLLPGVGPARARALVTAFGERTLDILMEDSTRALVVPGIGPGLLTRIDTAMAARAQAISDTQELLGLGLSDEQAAELQRRYHTRSRDELQLRPYDMVGEVGLEFSLADRLAAQFGVEDGSARSKAAIVEVVRRGLRHGHTAVAAVECATLAKRLAGVPVAVEAVEPWVLAGEAGALQFSEAACWEDLIAYNVQRMVERPKQAGRRPAVVSGIAERLHLSRDQTIALSVALWEPISIVSGAAGTGKSRVAQGIVDACRAHGQSVAVMAATWTAASRLSRSCGFPSGTVHQFVGRSRSRMQYPDVVVVDEAAMLDAEWMAELLDVASLFSSVVLIGDGAQLPPVGPGKPFHDLIESGVVPTVRLRTVYRQARHDLAGFAETILLGRCPDRPQTAAAALTMSSGGVWVEAAGRELERVVAGLSRRWPDAQVLGPVKRGTGGTRRLAALCERARQQTSGPALALNDETWARTGARVMLLGAADGEGRAFTKGDIGTMRAISREGCVVDVDGESLQYTRRQARRFLLGLGALTVHRAQASEFDSVIVAVPEGSAGLLSRELLYSAVSRARTRVAVVSCRTTLERGERTVETARRTTRLVERLRRPGGVAAPYLDIIRRRQRCAAFR